MWAHKRVRLPRLNEQQLSMAAKISMAISKAIKIPLPQQLYAYRLITSACFSTAYERTEVIKYV